jgi:hypothetical protein
MTGHDWRHHQEADGLWVALSRAGKGKRVVKRDDGERYGRMVGRAIPKGHLEFALHLHEVEAVLQHQLGWKKTRRAL